MKKIFNIPVRKDSTADQNLSMLRGPNFGRSSMLITKPRKSSPTPSLHCRFIPNTRAMDLDLSSALLDEKRNKSKSIDKYSNDRSTYSSMLASSLFGKISEPADTSSLPGDNILSFTPDPSDRSKEYINWNNVLSTQNVEVPGARNTKFRHIAQKPENTIEARNLIDDFFFNLLDWGSNNILAVALSDAVYLYDSETLRVNRLNEGAPEDTLITSVAWTSDGSRLAVGTSEHDVQIWDVERMKRVRIMETHGDHVGALAWNGSILSSGSADCEIHNHDMRAPDHHIATLAHHRGEVCGLKWSPNGNQLASGGNDNIVCVWGDQSSSSSSATGHNVQRWAPRYTFDHHTSAVKALAWCPWQENLLATGGGINDRHLRFWNTTTGACVNSINTKSQISSIQWSPNQKELLTSHGDSRNQLTVWKYPTMQRMTSLSGHTQNVLYTALSPDGQTVVSGGADEKLQFWKVFAIPHRNNGHRGPLGENGPLSTPASTVIR